MNTAQAWLLVGGLSKPGKMPGWSIGIPAKECNTGGKLQNKEGSVCNDCYALKGCYVFKVVQDAQYRRLRAIKNPRWVEAMALLINSKKPLTPSRMHWMPTKEAWVKKYLKHKPDNLTIRLSSPMVNQGPIKSWPNTSTVVTKRATCPAPQQGGQCLDCRRCWNPKIKNISYGQH